MAKDKHLVISYSRANPPTNGHLLVFNKTKEVADEVGGDHKAILSHSQDAKKNPLSAEQKVKFASKIAPGVHFVAANKELPTIMHHAKDAYEKGYTHLHIVAGSDRIDEYKKLLNKYHGPDSSMPFKGLHFHSAGERDPDAEGVTGISGTKMREFASNKDIESYKKGLPDHIKHNDAVEMMSAVRKGMKLEESIVDEGIRTGKTGLKQSTLDSYLSKIGDAESNAKTRKKIDAITDAKARAEAEAEAAAADSYAKMRIDAFYDSHARESKRSRDLYKSANDMRQSITPNTSEEDRDLALAYADNYESRAAWHGEQGGKDFRKAATRERNKEITTFGLKYIRPKTVESFEMISLKEFYLNEVSTEKLAAYKKAAGEDASKADEEGDTERANKRFSGIIKATNKQFDNDRKKREEKNTK